MNFPERQGLYDPRNEKDSCGIGFLAHIKGQRSHQIVVDANEMLINLSHRGGLRVRGQYRRRCWFINSSSP